MSQEKAMYKLDRLKSIIEGYQKVAVAYSGGVDSTLLLKVAAEVLGDRAIAIIARSAAFPKRELEFAVDFCNQLGIQSYMVEPGELDLEVYRSNPVDRCYHCKKRIFEEIGHVADGCGVAYILEGSNMDDTGDYRPGMRAIKELGIKSPLLEAELYKSEIRYLSRLYELPTFDKPSYACLASRIPYGEEITRDKLLMVGAAEELLHDMGFVQSRVRLHGGLARIEVEPDRILEAANAFSEKSFIDKLRGLGISYVTLDMAGYRTGSMNEVIL